MVWPFGKRRQEAARPTAEGPKAPRPEGADEAILLEAEAWLAANAKQATRRGADMELLVAGPVPGRPDAPAAAVLKVRRGKLAAVELYDPSLRPVIDALVKHFDRQQKWSFNGVITTR